MSNKKVNKYLIDIEQLNLMLKEQNKDYIYLAERVGKTNKFFKNLEKRNYPLYEPLIKLIMKDLDCTLEELVVIPDVEKTDEELCICNDNICVTEDENCIGVLNKKLDKIDLHLCALIQLMEDMKEVWK